MRITLIALSLALGYAIFNAGAVDPAVWNTSLLVTALAAALFFLIKRSTTTSQRPLDPLSLTLLATVLLTAAFQLVPLPEALLRSLSPQRHQLLDATRQLLHLNPFPAPLTTTPQHTLQYLLALTGAVVLLLTLRSLTLAETRSPWILTWPLLIIGAFQAALGFWQAYTAPNAFAQGTYDSRDHYAAMLEMILPFALLYPIAIIQRDRPRHESPALPSLKAGAWLVIAALLLIGIVHSLSRMGFLATLAAVFVCGSLTLTLRAWRIDYQRLPMPLWRRWLPSAIVAAIVLAGFVFLPTDPLIARFSELARTDDISSDTRARIWQDSAALIAHYPITGCGWGSYESCFLRYKTVAPMNTVDYAHNDYLQVLAEAGLVGFIPALLFALRLVWRTLRGATYAVSPEQRYLAIACTGSFTTILLHSAVDFNLYVPANLMILAWIAGIASVHLRQPAPQP